MFVHISVYIVCRDCWHTDNPQLQSLPLCQQQILELSNIFFVQFLLCRRRRNENPLKLFSNFTIRSHRSNPKTSCIHPPSPRLYAFLRRIPLVSFMFSAAYLFEVDGQIDFIEFHAPGQRRTLPPGLGAIDRVLWRMIPLRHRGIAVIADLQKRRKHMLEKEIQIPNPWNPNSVQSIFRAQFECSTHVGDV